MGTLEIKLSDRKYNLDTRDLKMKSTMSMVLLLCVVCSIAISNGNVLRDIDLSEDPMDASLKTSLNVDNNDVDLDADSNVPYLEERGPMCCKDDDGWTICDCEICKCNAAGWGLCRVNWYKN